MLVVVWKRADFRESSQLVTLVSRERGRFVALAKGSHRPRSAHLGKLDSLNRCEVELAGRGIPLLGRTRLVHEPRALREPSRFLFAAHAIEVLDAAMVHERVDPELFDLLLGTVTLLERAPIDRLPVVVLGFELRLLRTLGLLADLDHCPGCGPAGITARGAAPAFADPAEPGLSCAAHRSDAARRVPPGAIAWLRRLASAPGREWPRLQPDRDLGTALPWSAGWIGHALELRPSFRAAALAR